VLYEPYRCQKDLLPSLQFNPTPLKLYPSILNLVKYPFPFAKFILCLCSFFPTYFLTRQYLIQDGGKEWLETPLYKRWYQFLKHYSVNNLYGICALVPICLCLTDGHWALYHMGVALSIFFHFLALFIVFGVGKWKWCKCCCCVPLYCPSKNGIWSRRVLAKRRASRRINCEEFRKRCIDIPREVLQRYYTLRQQAPYLFNEQLSSRRFHFVKFHEDEEVIVVEKYYPVAIRQAMIDKLDFPIVILDEITLFLDGLHLDIDKPKCIVSEPMQVRLDNAKIFHPIWTRDVVAFSDDDEWSTELGDIENGDLTFLKNLNTH